MQPTPSPLRTLIRWLLHASLCGLLACSSPDAQPLRIATSRWPGYELLFLADSLGFFAQAGVRVQLLEFLGTGESRRALERGRVDAAGLTSVDLLFAQRSGPSKPRAVYVIDSSRGGDVILGRPPADHLQALRGRRIGIEPASINLLVLDQALHSVGLDLVDVTTVPLNPSAMKTAFLAGEVDAVTSYSPYAEDIAALPGVVTLFDNSQIPDLVVDLLAVDSRSLSTRQADWQRVIAALEQARQYLLDEPQAALAMIADHLGIDIEQTRQALAGLRFIGLDEQAQWMTPRTGALMRAIDFSRAALQDVHLLPPDLDIQALVLPLDARASLPRTRR